ncbi:MAG: hypothetical protein H7067_19830 [Burkholderiales bacterium]|nr:hypothetical protein [Opitutaceae bacterium]
MPEDEAGPNVSFERPYEGESPMSPTTLFAAAIMQAWGENIFINGNMRKIYVVADVDIDEPTRRWAASHAARYTGSFTAAVRAMDRVCWLPMVRNFSAQDIAQIVRGEVALAMEDKSMWTGEIMILIHRELPQSFGGICPRALGQLICDEVFTFSEFSLEDK